VGENAKKIGDRLEGFGQRLFERFGWIELTRDEEIKCHIHTHKSESDKRTRTHGVDIYHKFYEMYSKSDIGVITECKNYQWESINPSNIQKWFDQLLWTIECSQSSEELKKYNDQCDGLNTGILLVHANDGLFSEKKFREYLTSINYKSKRNVINIYVAGNSDIEKWDSMFTYIEKNFGSKDDEFKFYSPSILNSSLEKLDHITLNQLFSDYIIAENSTFVEETFHGREGFYKKTQLIIFVFDDISDTSFQYLCSMFKTLQLEYADEYIFVFYPRSQNDITEINTNFMKYACQELTTDKVEFAILDNRNLSPVDTK